MKKTMRILVFACLMLLICALTLSACDGGEDPQVPNGPDDGTAEGGNGGEGTGEGEGGEDGSDGAHQHTFGDWVVIRDATCTESGLKFRKCTTCDEEETEYITPHHAWIDANCQSPKTCETCGETEGDLGDHAYQTGMCTLCGTFDPNGADDLIYDGSAITIQFPHYLGMRYQGILESVIEEFNRLYPNITVDASIAGGMSDVIDAFRVYATVWPTVTIQSQAYRFETDCYTLPLDLLVSSKAQIQRADGTVETLGLTEEQISQYFCLQTGDDGSLHALPFSNFILLMFYDEAFFAEHGFSVPTTWDEMETLCAAIKAIDPDCYPLGIGEYEAYILLCERMGADYRGTSEDPFAFNNASVRECIARLYEWKQKGYVRTQEYGNSYYPGKYMNIDYHTMADTIYRATGHTGIAPLPQEDPDNPKHLIMPYTLCASQVKDPQEAIAMYLFIKFLSTNAVFQAEMSMVNGALPAVDTVLEIEGYDRWLEVQDDQTGIAAGVAFGLQDTFVASSNAAYSMIMRDQIRQVIVTCFGADITTDLDAYIQKLLEDAESECHYICG